jgi:5-methylthioadenosine/S-adenosylhomocysteine deaminase
MQEIMRSIPEGGNKMSILIKNGWLVLNNQTGEIIKDGYIYIENDIISEIGQGKDRSTELENMGGEVIDAKGKIVLPGLVNAHTHLFQTYMRGLADDKPLFNWLKEEVWPFAILMEEKDFYLAALIGCIENLKTGATSVIDQHYIHTYKTTSEKVFQAMEESGIRGNLCRVYADRVYEERLSEKPEVILYELEKTYNEWHGKQNGRLTMSIGPINPWGVTPDTMIKTKEFARSRGLKYQVHTAETVGVVQTSIDNYGLRNVDFFESLGILDENTQLAHSVWLNPIEAEIVKKRGSMVVHCPVANMYLASGVAPVPAYRKAGIPVALATDGPGSNNAQDMLSILKYTALLHKVNTLNAQILYPEDVLQMATLGGAKAMGMNNIGILQEGMKADIILVDWQKPHIAPVHKPVSAIVYNANGNDVDTVIVDGKVVVRNKRSTLIDEIALIEECQERVEFLKKKKLG